MALALGASCLALAALLTRFVDVPMAAVLQGSPAVVQLAGLVLSLPGDSAPYLAAACLLAPLMRHAARRAACPRRRRRWRHRGRIALFALVAVAGSGVMVNAVKYVVGRPRPWMAHRSGSTMLQPMHGSGGFASFPSGHANTIAVVALLGAWLLPRATPFFLLLAVGVSVGRVLLREHYPSDVLVGAALGVMTTIWFRDWCHARGWWIVRNRRFTIT